MPWVDMKKFSTRVLALTVSLWSATGAAGLIGAALSVPSIAHAQSKATPPIEINKDAPDRYIVVKGDTLWDIAGRFLEKPWRWPEIWQLNRDQIHDPHWIYPGDVVYLDYDASGRPRLRLGKPVGASNNGVVTSQIQPMTRSAPEKRDAIPTISAAAIEPFLNRPLIVDQKGLAEHPYIVGADEGRLFLSQGDVAYARGIRDQAVTEWQIYRPSKPILDPDTHKPIAYEALYIGSAHLEKLGDPSTLRITSTNEEIGTGDRLMPAEHDRFMNYVPHAPEFQVDGRIVSIYRGVDQAGRNSVVAMNVGSKQGLEVGHVLTVKQRGLTVLDRDSAKRGDYVKLPDQAVGYLLIFRVFDNISYGLILNASRSVSLGDNVTTP